MTIGQSWTSMNIDSLEIADSGNNSSLAQVIVSVR
jgi:hypothetical protein